MSCGRVRQCDLQLSSQRDEDGNEESFKIFFCGDRVSKSCTDKSYIGWQNLSILKEVIIIPNWIDGEVVRRGDTEGPATTVLRGRSTKTSYSSSAEETAGGERAKRKLNEQ